MFEIIQPASCSIHVSLFFFLFSPPNTLTRCSFISKLVMYLKFMPPWGPCRLVELWKWTNCINLVSLFPLNWGLASHLKHNTKQFDFSFFALLLKRSQEKKKELYGLLDMTVEKVSVTPKTSERTARQQGNYHHSFLVVCFHQPAKHTVAVEYFCSTKRDPLLRSVLCTFLVMTGRLKSSATAQPLFLFISCSSRLFFFSLSVNIFLEIYDGEIQRGSGRRKRTIRIRYLKMNYDLWL